MKKLLATFIASIGIVVLLPVATFAATPAQTIVTGTVTNSGNPVSGANVTVTCNSNVATDTTDSAGGYSVSYSVEDCPNGANASVTATKGGLHGSNSGGVVKETSKLNIALVDVSVVPEFGLITGVSTIAIAGGAFMVIRKRQTANQNV